MTAELPVPADLSLPEGRPAELAAFISVLAGAAFHAGVLDAHLAGPATSAPGWLGADSAAAAEQVGRTAALTRQVSEALTTAWHRLDAHHKLLVTAIGRIRALQAAQEDDFRHAHLSVAALQDHRGIYGLPDSAAPIVEELSVADRRRAQQHANLVDEVNRDAAAASRVLVQSCEGLGSAGAPEDGGRVLAYLAGELPGWGDQELSVLGAGLAGRFEDPIARRSMDELARDSLLFAGAPAFARAFLVGLGRRGVAYLLAVLGTELEMPPGPLAALLARALGAAWSRSAELPADADALTDVFQGHYVDAESRDSRAEDVAAGMGQVLLAGGSRMAPVTVAAWGEQMLARERARQLRGDDPTRPADRDPVVLVLDCLARSGDAAAAASLLSSPGSWQALLHRGWNDGGDALSALVAAAVVDSTPASETALNAGLVALGSGLSPRSLEAWTVNRDTAAALAQGLGLALARHVGLVASLLAGASSSARLDTAQDEALRGLGYLTIDERAARTIAEAIAAWAASHPGIPSPGPLGASPAVTVGSFVAVLEYGQRLAYALHGAEEMYRAVDRQFSWDMTVGLLVRVTPGPAGQIAGLLESPVARHFRADGTWENGRDLGMVLDREDAAGIAGAVATVAGSSSVPDAMAQARRGFDRTSAVLGTPRPPAASAHDALADLPTPPDPPEVDHEMPRAGRGRR